MIIIIKYLSFLCYSTEWETQMTQEIIEAGTIDSFLFPDLSSDHGSAVDIKKGDKLTESIHQAALSKDFSISSKLNAWDEVREEA